MKIVITSVSGEEAAEALRLATLHLENWLGAALGGADFGSDLDQVTVVVVAVDDDVAENSRWAKSYNKLGRFIHQVTSKPVKHLSISAQMLPGQVTRLSSTDLLAEVSAAIRAALAVRPARLPRGFAYDRFSTAASTALQRVRPNNSFKPSPLRGLGQNPPFLGGPA